MDSRYPLIASWVTVFLAMLVWGRPERGGIILAILIGVFAGVIVANISASGEKEPDYRGAALSGLSAMFIVACIFLGLYSWI